MAKLIKMVTPSGYEFWSSAEVIIGDKAYDMEDLNEIQRKAVATQLNIQALNAACAGRAKFHAKNGPSIQEIFEELV